MISETRSGKAISATALWVIIYLLGAVFGWVATDVLLTTSTKLLQILVSLFGVVATFMTIRTAMVHEKLVSRIDRQVNRLTFLAGFTLAMATIALYLAIH